MRSLDQLKRLHMRRCVYCGQPADTRDHVPPKCAAPFNTKTYPACKRCNCNILNCGIGNQLLTLEQRIAFVWYKLGIFDRIPETIEIVEAPKPVQKLQTIIKEKKIYDEPQWLRDWKAAGANLEPVPRRYVTTKAYSGLIVGRWTVLSFVAALKGTRTRPAKGKRWLCKCECGTIRAIAESSLTHRLSLSCGCLGNDSRKATRERLAHLWQA